MSEQINTIKDILLGIFISALVGAGMWGGNDLFSEVIK
jgi:hypothetical protein